MRRNYHCLLNRKKLLLGFSLIELLCVIGIIGVLMALILPAVMNAREASRRSECQNNFRQLGIALHNYHSAHGHFPSRPANEWSWNAQLLPFLEQANAYFAFNFESEPFASPNIYLTATIIPNFLCPSDDNRWEISEPSYVLGSGFAHTSYLGSLANEEPGNRGMFGDYITQPIRMGQVTDGASTTLFVGERGIPTVDVRWYGPNGWWVWGAETVLSASQDFRPGMPDDPWSAGHWWSHHPGGAGFLFVDGSVRFLDYSVDRAAFSGMGTKDGQEVVSAF